MNKVKILLGARTPFVRRPIFIEGISRGGKFLIGNLLHGVQGVEPIQDPIFTEQIPNLVRFGFMDRLLGEQMIRSEIDCHCYEAIIGRSLNNRIFDKSYIGNMLDYEKVAARSTEPDRKKLVTEFTKQQRYPCFILHESMVNIAVYRNLYPEARIIHIERNPIDLVYSWYQRHLLKRWATDTTVFQLIFQKYVHTVPWFALDNVDEYAKLSEIDKVIYSISLLQTIERKALKSLSTEQRKHFAVFHFDNVVTDPMRVITRLSQLLDKPMSRKVQSIIDREHLPVENIMAARKKKHKYILHRATRKSMAILEEANTKYEARKFEGEQGV